MNTILDIRRLSTFLLALGLVLASVQAQAELALGPFVEDDTGSPFHGHEAEIGYSPSMGVADFDGDGDLDVFLGHDFELVEGEQSSYEGLVDYYKNTGSSQSPVLAKQDAADNPLSELSGNTEYKPSTAKLDSDDLLDVVVGYNGGNQGILLSYQNNGTANAPSFRLLDDGEDPFWSVTVEDFPAPAIVEATGDGYKDIFVGMQGQSLTPSHLFLEYTGLPAYPSFTDRTDISPLDGTALQDFTAFSFGDLDDDGDQDMVMGAQNGSFDGVLRYFENNPDVDGKMVLTEQVGDNNPFKNFTGNGNASPSLADWDNDGDLDLLVGYAGRVIKFYRNEAVPHEGVHLDSSTVAENQPAGTVVGNLVYEGGTQPNHSFSLVPGNCGGSNDNDQFQIVVAELQTTAVLDYEAGAVLRISVHGQDTVDGTTDVDDRCLSVQVTNVEESVNLSSDSVAENQPAGTLVGQLSHAGGPQGASYTYTLAAGACGPDNAQFSINGNELLTTAELDYEKNRTLDINVQAQDDLGFQPETHCMTVKVTNEPDTVPVGAIALLLQ